MALSRYLTLLILCLIEVAAFGLNVDGIEYPSTRTGSRGDTLVLNGVGLRKATIFGIRVYYGALYTPARSDSADAILSVPGEQQLVLHFVREVSQEDIQDAWESGFHRNNPGVTTYDQELQRLFPSAVTMHPGEEMILSLSNDASSIIYPDGSVYRSVAPGFGSALLRIWLGNEPPNEELKSGLLGR